MSQWVIDTSPLIFLAKLGHLSLLQQGADALFVPPAVVQEVRAKPDPAFTELGEQKVKDFLCVPAAPREISTCQKKGVVVYS